MYIAYSISDLLTEWKKAQDLHHLDQATVEANGELSLMKQNNMQNLDELVIPTLLLDHYEFDSAAISDVYVFYQFRRIQKTDEASRSYFETLITITISRQEEFDYIMETYDLTPQNNMAYSEEHNKLYLNDNGRSIAVAFPEDMQFGSAEEASQLLEWQRYQLSDLETFPTVN